MRVLSTTRQVALAGLAAIALIAAGTSLVLSHVIVSHAVQRDARVSMEFLRSVTEVERPEAYFLGESTTDSRMSEYFQHISAMPNVLRANIFSADRRIIWSSDASLVGMTFGHNPELDSALLGRLEVSSDDVRWKPEHMLLGSQQERFIETYLPVFRSGNVIGVVEIYKSQQSLFESIHQELRAVWLCSFAGGAILYGLLLLSLRRGRHPNQELPGGASEALGTVAAAVTHGVGGRLAAIRSRAERGLEFRSRAAREASEEILFEVDALERWLLGLQAYGVRQSEGCSSVSSEPVPVSAPQSREDLDRPLAEPRPTLAV
jgi:two-component system sensor histidine kinase HydH